MSGSEVMDLVLGFVQGFGASTIVILVLFIGFCVGLGFMKTKRTAGNAPVIKSLDETVSHRAFEYLPPDAPRGPVDQLRPPELAPRT